MIERALTASPSDPGTVPEGWLDTQLQRLQRLVDLQAAQTEQLNAQGRRLLQRAIFATYIECRDLGISATARAVIQAGAEAAPTASDPTAPARRP